jgi:hypothetical protein
MGESPTGFTVAVLMSIKAQESDPEKDKAALEATQNGVLRGMSSDIIVQYNNALRDRHTVEINQRVVDGLIASNP